MRKRALVLMAALWVVGCDGQHGTHNQAASPVGASSHATAESGQGLAYLASLVGQHPNHIDLWATEPLNARLHALLGMQYRSFIDNMEVQGPLAAYDGVVWASGNRAHRGGVDAAVLLVDTRTDKLEVYLLTDHRLWHHAEREPRIALKGDAKSTVDQLREAAEQPR